MTVEIYPCLSIKQISDIPSAAEQRVYKAIKDQLPSDWLVIHSLEFLKEYKKTNSHSDREADFVIFAPDLGILVIEVKGGGIEYDKRVDKWFSIDRHNQKHEIKNPSRQAKEAKYEIARHLGRRLGNRKLLLAHGVLFPDLYDASGLACPDISIEMIGGSKILNSLEKWLRAVFNFWGGKEPQFEPLGAGGIAAAKHVFGKSVTVNFSLKTALERETERQIELTNQQKIILRQLKKRKTALIEGGAGTGKTVLALDHAISLSETGKKVLFLCYNQNLANSLKAKVNGVNSLHTMSFHEFCSWRVRQALSDSGRDLFQEAKINNPGGDFYDVLMPDALISSYNVSPISYSTIIVDEGQDFKDEFWLAIELLLENSTGTNFYVFRDCNQAIYTKCDFLPINSEPLYLFDNCRNTKAIHKQAYKYYQGIETEESELEGAPVEFVVKDTTKEQADAVRNLVNGLIGKERISPEDIVVVTEGNFELASNLLSDGKFGINWTFKATKASNSILVDTAKRFKGMESKLLIFWVLDDSFLTDSLIYVAASRARLRLWVVGNNKTIHKIRG